MTGDYLVIFTDGVVEAFNKNDEEYGEQKLLGVVNHAADGAPPQLLQSLLADLDGFVGNTPQHDDMTCLVLKRG